METLVEPIFDYSKSEQYHTRSNSIEITSGNYNGIRITERYVNPTFWGKKPTRNYLIDLVLPMGTYDCLSDAYYTAEGYGMPVFKKLELALEFIDAYKETIK